MSTSETGLELEKLRAEVAALRAADGGDYHPLFAIVGYEVSWRGTVN